MRRLALIASTMLLGSFSLSAFAAQAAETSAADCWLKAFKAADTDAVAQCYAPDAIMWFPGGPMAKGRDAIREGYAGYFKDFNIKQASLAPMGSQSVGDTVVTWGTFTLVMMPKAGGADVTEQGRFTDVTKMVDGKWRYLVDHASDDPAAPAK